MTYAAIYIQKEKTIAKIADAKAVQTLKGQLSQAVNSAKTKIKNLDLKSMAKNINLQSASEFTQKYAVAAINTIVNERPVSNQTMLDALFNGFAPALNITAAQTGFNSIMEMKNAVKSGNINAANFVQGFQNGLSIISQTTPNEDYSKYGEEIVIDLISNVTRNYIAETPDRRVQEGQTYNEYLHNLPLTLAFSGLIMDGKNYKANEFSDRLEEIMLEKIPFTLRAGNKIYENYVFTSFTPRRETQNGILFDAEIKFIQTGTVELVKVNVSKQKNTTNKNNVRKQISNNKKTQDIKNKTKAENYAGAYGFARWFFGADPTSNSNTVNTITKILNSYK